MNGLALCAGFAGLELGRHIAEPEFRGVCFVERQAEAAATLVAGMEDPESPLGRAPIWDDVATFDGRAWRGLVDIVTAGYPCQPDSVAGKRLGAADERWIWPDIARIVRDVEPEWLFCENVAGHRGLNLAATAACWPTMAARDWRAPNAIDKPLHRMHAAQLNNRVATWPTARACSGERSSGAPATEFYRCWAAAMGDADPTSCACLSSLLALLNLAPGSRSCATTLASRRQLNVRFVERLMGLPDGWSDCTASGITSSRWLRLSRTALSELLCSPAGYLPPLEAAAS